jgi:hypothetical protein
VAAIETARGQFVKGMHKINAMMMKDELRSVLGDPYSHFVISLTA